jgi:anti-sigma factor ChrR (cupin superfamily)
VASWCGNKREIVMAGRGHRDIFAGDIAWGEGSSPGISYARFRMDEDDASAPSIVLSRFVPGEVVEPHTHGTNYCEYVISGEQTVGKTVFRAGDVRIVKAGTGYGPIVTGPDGCEVLIVFQNASGAMMQPMGKAKV